MFDEVEDAAHLLDRGLLPAHVLDADPEVGVVGVDDRLADARVDVEGAEEQEEVRAQQEEQIDELREDLGEQSGQRRDRVLRRQPEDVVHGHEVDGRDRTHEEGTAPENRAGGFDGALTRVRLGRHALADDQRAAHDAQDAAAKQHRQHRVGE